MAEKPQGVYQREDGQYSWFDKTSGKDGEGYGSDREAARAAYLEQLRENEQAEPAAPAATATGTERPVKASSKRAKKGAAKTTTKEETVSTKGKGKKAATSRSPNGPVAKARAIFAKMGKARRKDVIAACVKAGIKENTAKTYYQKFRSSK